jgi:hypothetical protein
MSILKTLNILKNVKKTLFDKRKHGNIEEEYINNQIRAIDSIIIFTDIMLKHFSVETLEKIMKDELANIDLLKELTEERYCESNMENKDIEIKNMKKYETSFTKDIILRLNHKLVISIVLYDGRKYIILEPQKYLKHTLKWVNWPNLKFPAEIIYENRKRIKDENK